MESFRTSCFGITLYVDKLFSGFENTIFDIVQSPESQLTGRFFVNKTISPPFSLLIGKSSVCCLFTNALGF